MTAIEKYWPWVALLIYLVGLAMLPGWFYYRSCPETPKKDRDLCTAYSTLFWPAALPIHIVYRGVVYSFSVWRS